VNKRMIAALIALAGAFVALYLMLYKLGYIGTLVCAVGSCEVVQTSRWARLGGVPVAGWGVAYYLAILAASLAGLSPALVDSRRLSQALVAVTAVGVAFSLWLTYLELFVIDAICMWCVISALLATALFVVCWLDLRDVSTVLTERDADFASIAAARLRGEGWGTGLRNTSEVSLRAIDERER
jgi:uncharacterized membrane protein